MPEMKMKHKIEMEYLIGKHTHENIHPEFYISIRISVGMKEMREKKD